MNLLYLIILVPLFSFLLLSFMWRQVRLSHTIVIGLGTISIIFLLTMLVYIDYSANMVPDTSLIYSRYLWQWFSIGDFSVPISLSLDGLSLIFIVLISFISLLIYFFAVLYFKNPQDIGHFFAYGNLLLSSLFVLILADNIFVFFIGWEGVSFSTYLLISIYSKHNKSGLAAIKTFIAMHIADIFLIVGMFIISNELGTLNIRELQINASEQLAIDSDLIWWVTLLLFIGAAGKAAIFPLHIWFSESTVVPLPTLTLLQSSTVVLSGIYLMLRFSDLFSMSTDLSPIIAFLSLLTLVFSCCIALVQNDIKRIVTYINLAQISYIFLAIAVKQWETSIYCLINYAITSSLLLLLTTVLIYICNGERDINKLGGLAKHCPLLYGCFLLASAALSAMPWITFSFYLKGDIIWHLMTSHYMGTGAIALIGVLLLTLCILRLIFAIFHQKPKTVQFASFNRWGYLPIIVLILMTTAVWCYLPLFIDGVVPTDNSDSSGHLLFQLLLAAVTILGGLISYILFAQPNIEINEIANAPISKFLIRHCGNEWRFDRLLHFIFARPYLFATRWINGDPLLRWENRISWMIQKIDVYLVMLENGRLRWYMISLVMGGIFILLLLIFI